MRPIAALPDRTHLPPVLLQHHRAMAGFGKASTRLTGSAAARTGLFLISCRRSGGTQLLTLCH